MGIKRYCTRYRKVKTNRGRELRCDSFKKTNGTAKSPVCWKGLRDGGRSPGLLRKQVGLGGCTRRVVKQRRAR